MALQAYRHLLRATKIAFEGDSRLLFAARTQARHSFEQNRTFAPASPEAQKAIDHCEGVAEVLTKNVVQGRPSEIDAETLKLRIHEHTERGDNDTIKNPLVPGGKVKIGGS